MTDPNLFDHYAEGYDRTVEDAIAASGESVRYFAELKAALTSAQFAQKPIRTILDFGCGIGNTTRSLAAQFPRARITGVDASHESISTANRLTETEKQVSFVANTSTALPFGNQSFDLVFASCVLHHIDPQERPAWVRELFRVCSPAGSLIVFEHNPFNPFTRQVVRSCPFDEGVVLLRPWETKDLLKRAGFRSESPQFYFFFPHSLRTLRPVEGVLRWLPAGAQYYVIGTR